MFTNKDTMKVNAVLYYTVYNVVNEMHLNTVEVNNKKTKTE